MNKKVVGGLLAVLFVTQMAQTGAILKMQKVASAPRVQNVAMAPVEDYQYDFNQQAAVGSGVISNPDPDQPQGFTIITYDGTSCTVMVYNEESIEIYTGSTMYYLGNPVGCRIGGFVVNSGEIEVLITHKNNTLAVSSGDATLEAQFKLMLLGYLSDVAITGKMDIATQSALKAFQTDNKISVTGTYGPQTKAALDKKIGSSKTTSVTGTKFTLPK